MVQPSFQDVMLPILQIASDGQPHSIRELFEQMGSQFNLTEEEKTEMVPSGRQRILYNRVAWALAHLKRAGLITPTNVRGSSKITQEGRSELATNPSSITIASLKKYPSYNNFYHPINKTDEPDDNEPTPIDSQTPDEIIGEISQRLNQQLAQDLLESIQNNTPDFFEKLVVDLFLKMGYGGSEGSGKVTRKSNDGGIDGIIKQDKLGLDTIYLQAKRWEKHATIQQPEIHKFAGALMGFGANKGVFITTAKFSHGAIKFAQSFPNSKIVLIDGLMLAKLMIKYEVGVSLSYNIEIKRIDSDYFEEL
jgi:restriction system protein